MEERRRPEQRQRLDDAAAGAEDGLALVRNGDLGLPARLQVLLDLVGEMVDVDHGGLHADRGEAIEHVIDQRLAAHRHQRFGHRIGERAHARAKAGGQDHGPAWNGASAEFRHLIPWLHESPTRTVDGKLIGK